MSVSLTVVLAPPRRGVGSIHRTRQVRLTLCDPKGCHPESSGGPLPRSPNRCLDLSWRVVTLSETACGFRDERLQRRNIV